MERLTRLRGIVRRESPVGDAQPAAALEQVFSVLDLGRGAVKAAVISAEGERARLLSFAGEAGGRDDAALLRAAERALVRAEDAAGHVPRQVVAGIGAARCVFARNAKDARLALAAERGAAAELVPVGQDCFAAPGEAERVRRLVGELDLDLSRLVPVPAAHARLSDAAIVVDAGAEGTGVTVSREGRVRGAVWLPVGGTALAERLEERLGVGPAEVGRALAAHAAGAGNRSAAGLSAGRVIGELARHHADVWCDALETGLAQLTRTGSLPSTIALCGGGARLPELRAALEGEVWRSALPFDGEPRVVVLGSQDVPGLEAGAELRLGPESVTVLCLAMAAIEVRGSA